MKAKVACGDDIRRWHYPSQNRYANLTSFVEKVFDLGQKKEYFIQFEDPEMDKVTICNEQDLSDAFECAEQEKRQSLKIFVTAGRVSDTHEVPTQAKDTGSNDTKTDECEEPNECDWQQVVLKLLLSENIRCLLPELVRRVICVLREKKESGEASLAVVVPLVLKEKEFESIVQNELYKKYGENLLPVLLSQASCFNHILLSLNEEAVGKWVADMLDLVVFSIAEDNDNRLWKMHFDMWREQELSGGQAIHFHVKCDICGVTPIRGARYKCAVCEDYDLCENCESSGQHSVDHPFVKMARPMCGRNVGKHHFLGLHEIVRKYHGGRRMGMGMPQHGPCWMKFGCGRERKRAQRCKRGEKEKKLTKCQQKLIGKLEKINSKLKHGEEQKSENNIKCVCGHPLMKMTPIAAYNCLRVTCDWCDEDCTQDAFIFHCPLNNSKHPSGFDVCMSCASGASAHVEKEEKKVEKVEEKEKVKKVEEKEKEKVKKVEEKEKVEKVEEPLPPKRDPFEGFEYANEARQLLEMGFPDTDRIKYLLVNKKGDLNQIIFEMFQ